MPKAYIDLEILQKVFFVHYERIFNISFHTCRSEGNRYFRNKEKEILKWKELRKELENAFIEGACMPPDALCCLCHEKPTCEDSAQIAETRCLDCGTDMFMCVDCCLQSHKKRNKLHYLEKWQVKHIFLTLPQVVVYKSFDDY